MADGEEVPPTAAAAAEDSEELEPLFDYTRVRPTFDFRFDDTDLEKSDIFVHCNKRPKLVDDVADDADAVANEKGDAGVKKAAEVNLDDEDWLATPPLKLAAICKDKASHQPRLEKQDVAKLVEDTFQKVVETAQKDFASKKPPESIILDELTESEILHKPTVPHVKKAREPILITVQGIDGKQQQFRIYKDDKFDKIFNAYAKKVQLSPSNLTFTFDGDKINSASTPQDLDLEDDDMIEVCHKSS